MTDVLQKEIEDLKNQLAQKDTAIEGLLSQMDAHREVLNEHMNTNMNLRTNIIHVKKSNNKLVQAIEAEKTKCVSIQNELDSSLKRITELDAELSSVKSELEGLKLNSG